MGQLGRELPPPTQCGSIEIGGTLKGVFTPEKILPLECTCDPLHSKADGMVAKVICGSESSFLSLPCGRCVWAWGWNEHGNLGVGDKENKYFPAKVLLPHGISKVGTIRAAGATLIVIGEGSGLEMHG